MITDKEKFTLSLQGYKYAGYLPFWSITEGELAAIFEREYNHKDTLMRLSGTARYSM